MFNQQLSPGNLANDPISSRLSAATSRHIAISHELQRLAASR
jgi:hypothetical protein